MPNGFARLWLSVNVRFPVHGHILLHSLHTTAFFNLHCFLSNAIISCKLPLFQDFTDILENQSHILPYYLEFYGYSMSFASMD